MPALDGLARNRPIHAGCTIVDTAFQDERRSVIDFLIRHKCRKTPNPFSGDD